jgi:branched-subunit amino acid transport protein
VSSAAAIAAIGVIGVITYASRAGLIVFLADRQLPFEVARALRYVGPAVLSALTVNLLAGGRGASGVSAQELAAVGVGAAAAVASKNLVVSLAAGMATLWVVILFT